MSPAARYGYGGYVASGGGSENWYSITPRLSGVKPGLIFFHGAGGEETALWPTWSPNTSHLAWFLAEWFPVLLPDNSTAAQPNGAQTWGTDASTDTVDAAITYAQANPDQFQIAPGKVVLCGSSMGHITACNYARRFPGKVAGIIGMAGATDIDYHHANGFAANIDAAYPGGNWDANNPIKFADTLTFPHRYYYATDDDKVPPAGVGSFEPFYAAYAGPHDAAVSMGTGGHTDVPIANIDRLSLLRFIASCFA